MTFCRCQATLIPLLNPFSRRCVARLALARLALAWLVLGTPAARATITVQDYWRMGEADSGAIAGGTPTHATDSVGTHSLVVSGPVTYSSDVAAMAFAHTSSALSFNFTNSAFATNTIISTVQNNFGLEAWVKPASLSGNPILVYNGSTGGNGWGFLINGGNYEGLLGDVAYVGSGVATTNVWTHLALVCNNSVTTFYINGVPAGAYSGTPLAPAGNFAIAAPPQSQSVQLFNGLVDEVRFFTFAANQFSTNDLLFYSAPSTALGTTSLLVGPAPSTNSVALAVRPSTSTWSATANASWLHLVTGYQSGTGSTNVLFTCDTNSGATRSGTFTLGGQLLTVTQAGSTYIAAGPVTTLVSSGLSGPTSVTLDEAGNVYIVDSSYSSVKKWTLASNTVTTLMSSLTNASGVAVDLLGNVYAASGYAPGLITKWSAANSNVTTVASSGLVLPTGVGTDFGDNLFIVDAQNSAVEELPAAGGSLSNVITSGLGNPYHLALDVAENIYIVDNNYGRLLKWTAAKGTLTTNVSGLKQPTGVAVDGGGNIYMTDTDNNAVRKWMPTTGAVTTFTSSGLNAPSDVAVDASGNVYIDDSGNGVIKELPNAFVDPTAKLESVAAGSDTLVVLPATVNLTGPFAPASDSAWLTINGITNGVVSFSFTANTSPYAPTRTAHISLLGQTITVTQAATPFQLVGVTNILVGPASGSNSVVLEISPATNTWTGTANASWLHLVTGYQSDTGGTNVVFTYDANSGATRSGTLTLAGQTVTVTQAGSTYVQAGSFTTLISSGLSNPSGLAVDGLGNLYIADAGHNAVKKWTAANNTLSTLISSSPDVYGIALDLTGNLYVTAGNVNAKITKLSAGSTNATTVWSSSSDFSYGIDVDLQGNLCFAGGQDNVIRKWSAADGSVSTVVSSLNFPYGVALDAAENVYIADTENNVIRKLTAANGNLSTVVSGLNQPYGVTVDGSGNIYIADTHNNVVKERTATSGAVTTLASGLNYPNDVAVDAAGNVYIADSGNNAIEELPYAFVDPTARSESASAGSDTLVVLPATVNLTAPFAPVSDSSWLTITGVTNGVVSFSFAANSVPYAPSRTAHITVLGQSIAITQARVPYQLVDTTNILVGPATGSNSVALEAVPATSAWTATANASWLHVPAGYQSGAGCTNVVFTYDANSGATRSGTLTIAGKTVTVTQAGSTYVAARPVTTLATGLNYPNGLTVDGAGNVYIADTDNNAVKEWIAASNSVATLVSSGLNNPQGVALDSAGNVYIADTGDGAVKKWSVASKTVTSVTSSNSALSPYGLTLDTAGNVYIAEYSFTSYTGTIDEWSVANGIVTTPVTSPDDGVIQSLAADVAADNIYFTENSRAVIMKWSAANGAITTSVSSGLSYPDAVAVDGSGNIYIVDLTADAVKEWSAASGSITTLVSGLSYPNAVAVDATGNVYYFDTGNNVLKELPYAFVDTTTRFESSGAGSDTLPVVLPATENLKAPFAPVSDSSWLTITGVTNGVVSFSFAANYAPFAPSRTGHITVLGKSTAITQSMAPLVGATNLLVGPASGTNSVALEIFPATSSWTASANASWLHLSAANQSGVGCTNVIFTYDANAGATRSGTLTIAGQTVTVTQAGSTYVAARPLTTLVSGLFYPQGLAVDRVGNVYIADTDNNAVKEWVAASNAVTTLVSSGLSYPGGLAVDASGNVYIADTENAAVKKWQAATKTVTTLASTNSTPVAVGVPYAVSLDLAGDVYIADGNSNRIEKWSVASNNVTAAVSSGVNGVISVAVDLEADNIYFIDSVDYFVKKWTAANGAITTVVSAGMNYAEGVAADGSGNLYIANTASSEIDEWSPASGATTTLVPNSSGLNTPVSVTVDATGNVYFVDTYNNAVKELPYAFVDRTSRSESAGAGSDVLPVVLPATENLTGPFVPASDSPWLTINGATNGVAGFSFTGNPSVNGTSRTAHITLLGQSIAITQGAATYALSTNMLTETAAAGTDSVVLTVVPANAIWTATTNATWLHLSTNNQSGIGSATVTFSFDANTGPTRQGTLTIAGQTLTVTQGYVVTPPLLTNMTVLGNGAFQFSFNSISNATFSVWATTNVSLPFTNWMLIGPASNVGSGLFQFTSPPTTTTNNPQIFFRISSP